MRVTRPLPLALAAVVLLGQGPNNDVATEQRLGGPLRYLTHLETDKPIYKLGEVVWVRGTMLDARRHAPGNQGGGVATLEIKGPKGETLATARTQPVAGTFGFSWTVPEGAAGGEYQVISTSPMSQRTARAFDVRVYRPPRLKTQIVFARDGYGPGDEVRATVEVTRAEGGAPTGAKVTAVARVDGAEVARVGSTVDATGHAAASFLLPKAIERGEGSLAFTIEDGGVVETAAKTIPILLQTVDLTFYPEGGDLVAGLPARVYVEARTPAQKPADLAGSVLDASGAEVASLRTEHEGRGRFTFTPKKGVEYRLKLTSPAGIRRTFPLPPVKASGAVLAALEDVTKAGANVRLRVAWTGDRVVRVTLRHRERELDSVVVDASRQQGTTVSLKAGDVDGVLVATVTEKNGLPLAERLIFRKSAKQVVVELLPVSKRTTPGAQVKLKLRTTVDGKPVPAVVGLTVTDDAVLEMVEKREQAPTLPVMALLESEVRELRDAHVYLGADASKSALALDLLLGTQGWRRFAFLDVGTFLARHSDDAQRVLAFVVPQVQMGLRGEAAFEDMLELAGGPPGQPPQAAPEKNLRAAAGPRPPSAPRPAPQPSVARPAPPPAALPAAPPAEAPLAKAKDNRPEPAMPGRGAPPPQLAERARKQVEAKVARRQREEVMLADELGQVKGERHVLPRNVVVVREFVHQVRPERRPNDRLDFAETLYWSAGVQTDATTGEATVGFGTSDSVTSFRIRAGAFTTDGVLGSADVKLDSVQPFYLEPRLPLELTAGDLVRLPVAVVNGTPEPLSEAKLELAVKGDVRFAQPGALSLRADERARRVVELAIGPGTARTQLTLTGRAGSYEDVVTRELTVVPRGFPAQLTFGGVLEKNGKASHQLTLPPDTVPNSVRAELVAFPSPMGNLTQAVSSLIREPGGCFEQTSSTTYPMTMALQYLTTHSGADPKLIADAKDKLDRGYQRLVGFECKEKGYEWFGQDPGHEALTAYGLLQFTDMKKVREVDATMLSNTRAWLMKQRDGKGGFERKRRALHTWIEDKDTSDAYIAWSLLESGEKGLDQELGRVISAGQSSKNSYVVALAANVAWLGGDKGAAKKMMASLAALQDQQGLVGGGTQSIVGSSGETLSIETTSLATLAWLRTPDFRANAERAMKALAESCKGGRYGSTQSTVLALRAILEHSRQAQGGKGSGSVQVLVNGKKVGSPVRYDENTQGTLVLANVSELLGPGAHTIELALEGGARLPYSGRIAFYRLKPESSPSTKVALDVQLGKAELSEGAVVEAVTRVRNVTDEALPMVVAIVGLPGGLEPRHDQLKELVKQKTIDAYEVMGRDVVLYWRGLTPKQDVRVPLSVIAQVPGKYVGPASRAYLYYGDEHKVWVEGLTANIAAKN